MKCNTRHERRQKLLRKVTADYEGDETARHLNLGPVKLELRTESKSGGPSQQTFSEEENSARPVAPFPFKNEQLLTVNQKHRIEKVWASSRAIKKSRLDNQMDAEQVDVYIDVTVCTICQLNINSEKKECSACLQSIHIECYDYNSEWAINGRGNMLCKMCNSTNRLAYADSI
jgi:hypothetical protein